MIIMSTNVPEGNITPRSGLLTSFKRACLFDKDVFEEKFLYVNTNVLDIFLFSDKGYIEADATRGQTQAKYRPRHEDGEILQNLSAGGLITASYWL